MDLKELNELKNAYETALREKGQEIIKVAFRDMFDENPDLISLRWTQYTPYFNDGEACVFSVHDPEAKWVGMPDYDPDEDEEDVDHRYLSWWDPVRYPEYAEKNPPEWLREVVKTFGQIPDDLFLAAFGDHSEIIASRSGFDVDEYSHD